VRHVSIDAARCDRSPGCPARRACPRGAIVPVAGGTYPGALGYTVDEKRCTGCAICARYCPGGAVHTA
jgi:Fe-S-cluster-containing hydrogenase component 2